MCGLFSLFSGRFEMDSQILNPEEVESTLAPRGPDAFRQETRDNLYLAHSRLKVIDLDDRSNQPFQTQNWLIAYNGEIFNFKKLRQILKSEGWSFNTESDTEVLALAIEAWGPQKAMQEFHGMYAFAAYSLKENSLYIARDPLGIKPLYWTLENDYVACASWPSTLLKGLKKEWKLDRLGLTQFFMLGGSFGKTKNGDRSLVDNINMLPPGQLVKIDENLKVHKETPRPFKKENTSAPQYSTEELLSLLKEVQHEHLESDVPMTVFLSGGVDSTLLAALSQKTVAFHLESGEQQYAQEAADFLKIPFVCVDNKTLSALEIDDLLLEYATKSGQIYSSALQPQITCRAMQLENIKVGISANGADELFLGYPSIPSPNLPETVLPSHERASVQTIDEQMQHIFSFPSDFKNPKDSDQKELLQFFFEEEKKDFSNLVTTLGEEAAHRMYHLQTYVKNDLNPNLDHASMLYGIEMRVPFLDTRVVDFALQLGSEQLIRPEIGRKAPLKDILDHLGVPRSIWFRLKQGFSLHSSTLLTMRDHRLGQLEELRKDELLHYMPLGGNLSRDFFRTLSAASAFSAWKKAWIDTGVVSV